MTTPPDKELVKIDGEPLTVSDFILALKFSERFDVLQEATVRFSLNNAFAESGIIATDEEIEKQMDAFRAKRGLLSGAATKHWLDEHHLTDQEFHELIIYQVKLGKLKEKLADQKIEEQFAYNKLSLDRVELYRIIADDEPVAKELMAQVREGTSFFELAKTYSVDDQTRRQCGYLGIVKRGSLKPEVESVVFNARPGDVVGPVKSSSKFHIYLVENIFPAMLDEATRELLVEQIFREWLDLRLKDTDIDILI